MGRQETTWRKKAKAVVAVSEMGAMEEAAVIFKRHTHPPPSHSDEL
jgi:hypothetical protein